MSMAALRAYRFMERADKVAAIRSALAAGFGVEDIAVVAGISYSNPLLQEALRASPPQTPSQAASSGRGPRDEGARGSPPRAPAPPKPSRFPPEDHPLPVFEPPMQAEAPEPDPETRPRPTSFVDCSGGKSVPGYGTIPSRPLANFIEAAREETAKAAKRGRILMPPPRNGEVRAKPAPPPVPPRVEPDDVMVEIGPHRYVSRSVAQRLGIPFKEVSHGR